MKSATETFFADKTVFSEAVNAYLPGTAYVSLAQEGIRKIDCAVTLGDRVEEGQIIAGKNNAHAAAIHAPIPGIIENFVSCLMPDGKAGLAVKIRLSGAFSYLGKSAVKSDWKSLNKRQLYHILAEKGVVNLFSRPVCLAEEMRELKKNKDHILIVRLNDEDSSQQTDSFIARRYQTEIAEGAAILVKAADIAGVVLLYDKNREPPDREEFASQINGAEIISVPVAPRQYLSSTVQAIISTVRQRQAGPVFDAIAHTDLFVDASTLLNVYRAVVFSLPVMENIIHVSGSVIHKPGIFSVRNGTLVRNLVEECGGFNKPYSAVVINGVIAGMSITTLDMPITKQVKSIRFLHRWELPDQSAQECIRCGNCTAICPSQLDPGILFSYVCGIKIVDPAYIASAALCEDCALCNTVCPSRLPLCQYISLLKEAVLREKK
ncbi:MAG: SLBB domain-containing protein [Treponema sp.]|jgi:electron transport complex protein RnfC|nr:SLBB domain-containing protein [Treponema sp.]